MKSRTLFLLIHIGTMRMLSLFFPMHRFTFKKKIIITLWGKGGSKMEITEALTQKMLTILLERTSPVSSRWSTETVSNSLQGFTYTPVPGIPSTHNTLWYNQVATGLSLLQTTFGLIITLATCNRHRHTVRGMLPDTSKL